MRRLPLIVLATAVIATSAAAIEPGQWRSTTRMIDIQLPGGMPDAVANMLRSQMSQGRSTMSCISQEDIDNAPEQMFEQSDGDCEYTEFEMSGGELNATAQCRMPEGTMTMVMTGTYTDDTYEMQFTTDGDAGMGPMSMTFETTGERVGNCG